MSHSYEDEISEIIEYVTGMRRTFNRKLDDHLFIMEQQNHRIEEQYRIIDEQRVVIDELAWQIRDLRDSVRQVSEQKSSCVCNYENHVSRHHRNKDQSPMQGSNRIDVRLEEIDEDHEDIYEKIDVTNSHLSDRSDPIPLARNITNPSTPKYTEVNKFEPNKSNATINRTTRYIRPANSTQGMPGMSDRTEIANSLHDALNRLKFENLAERDSIDEEGSGDILLRTKPFKQFARNSLRGSSKVMCSMVSDIDQDYLPNEEELNEENYVRISSRHVVSDAVIDYDNKGDSSKRAGIVL